MAFNYANKFFGRWGSNFKDDTKVYSQIFAEEALYNKEAPKKTDEVLIPDACQEIMKNK